MSHQRTIEGAWVWGLGDQGAWASRGWPRRLGVGTKLGPANSPCLVGLSRYAPPPWKQFIGVLLKHYSRNFKDLLNDITVNVFKTLPKIYGSYYK